MPIFDQNLFSGFLSKRNWHRKRAFFGLKRFFWKKFCPKMEHYFKDIRTKIEHFLTNRVKLMNLYPDIKRVIRSGFLFDFNRNFFQIPNFISSCSIFFERLISRFQSTFWKPTLSGIWNFFIFIISMLWK